MIINSKNRFYSKYLKFQLSVKSKYIVDVIPAYSILFFITFFFSSCLKEEIAVPLPPPSDAITQTIDLEPNYKNQVYFNLEKSSVVSTNLKTDWDFSIDNDIASIVRLNQAKYMFAVEDKNPFGQKTDTIGFEKQKKWDACNVPDTLCLINCKYGRSYIIDFGIDELGNSFGFRKVKITKNGSSFLIETANLDATEYQYFNIKTLGNCNRVHISMKKKALVQIEPDVQNWDLCFTQYMHTFYKPYIPYLVVGALTNPITIQSAVDSTTKFEEINIKSAQKLKFCTQTDMIGYDWKNYINGVYTINRHKNYIIRKDNGLYFKIRFVDFYNDKGQKGYPKFEYKRL